MQPDISRYMFNIPNSNSPSLSWGNQQTMWELTPAAKKAAPSERIMMLAQPKKNMSTQEDLK